jgi:hypothetical protein
MRQIQHIIENGRHLQEEREALPKFDFFVKIYIEFDKIEEKATPAVRQGRKATGLKEAAGLPW